MTFAAKYQKIIEMAKIEEAINKLMSSSAMNEMAENEPVIVLEVTCPQRMTLIDYFRAYS